MEKYLLKTYKDALELGSLIESEDKDYKTYEIYLDDINNSGELSSDFYGWQEEIYPLAKSLVKQADILKRKWMKIMNGMILLTMHYLMRDALVWMERSAKSLKKLISMSCYRKLMNKFLSNYLRRSLRLLQISFKNFNQKGFIL